MAYNTGSVPTLAQEITGKFVPEIFSTKVLDIVKSNLVVVAACNQTYKDDLKKGSVVNIPVFSEVSTTEVTPGTEPTAQNAVGTATSITVTKWREATVEESDLEGIEESADYLDGAANGIAYAVAKYIDTDVGSLFSTLASSSVYGADGQTFDDALVIALMEILDEADIPDDGKRVIIADPSTKADALTIDKFIRNDYVRNPVVPTGKFGDIYNMSLLITNNLTAATTGNYGAMMHQDAIGVVMQSNPRTRRIPMPWKFITKFICDAAWGRAVIRTTFGKSFYTRKS